MTEWPLCVCGVQRGGGGSDNDRLVRVLRGDDDAADDGGGAEGIGRGGTAQAGVPAPPPVSTDFLATEVRANLRRLDLSTLALLC